MERTWPRKNCLKFQARRKELAERDIPGRAGKRHTIIAHTAGKMRKTASVLAGDKVQAETTP
jgi:hypothetical protein